MKLNILVTMAGRGKRFTDQAHRDMQYGKPKPMIVVDNKSILARTLGSLPHDLIHDSNLYFVVLKEHVVDHGIDTFIKNLYPDSMIFVLDEMTRGNLETAFEAVKHFGLKTGNPLLILDADNQYDGSGLDSFIKSRHALVGGDFVTIAGFKPLDQSDKWCIATVNGTKALDITEKVVPSGPLDRCMVGVFYFSSDRLFMDLADNVLWAGMKTSEFYMSEAIILAGYTMPIFYFEVNDPKPLGTPEDVEAFLGPSALEQAKAMVTKMKKLRFCFDLDGTICYTKTENQTYADVEPLPGAVEYLKELRERGHYIIIQTARNMQTCDGDVGKVIARQGKITIDWLEKYGVPYDELYFGKPNADIYVDDKAIHHITWSPHDSDFYHTPGLIDDRQWEIEHGK